MRPMYLPHFVLIGPQFTDGYDDCPHASDVEIIYAVLALIYVHAL